MIWPSLQFTLGRHGTLDRTVFARAREALDDRIALTLIPFAGPRDSVALSAQSLNSIVHPAIDLQIEIFLIEQTPDGCVDEATMIVRRNNDADSDCFSLCPNGDFGLLPPP
jgi:hypothetical protein